MEENLSPAVQELSPFPSIKQCILLFFQVLLFSLIGAICACPVYFLTDGKNRSLFFFVYYTISFGGMCLFLYRKLRKRTDFEPVTFSIDDWKTALGVMAASIFLQTGLSVPLISLIPMPESIKEVFMNSAISDKNLWSFTSVVILAPLFEEYICRKVVLGGLLKRYSPLKAILISALFFAFIHLNPWQGISAFLLGALCGWVYYRTRNLVYPVLIHFSNNGYAVLGAYLSTDEKNTEMNLVDYYGGPVQMLLILTGILLLLAGCLYLLSKWMPRQPDTDSLLFEKALPKEE